MNKHVRSTIALVASFAISLYAHAAPPRLLGAAEVPHLLQAPLHGERIVALWALDCAYCEPNLVALARLQQRHPERVQLVLVATDGPAASRAVEARLRQYGLVKYVAWVYADSAPARLNYLIDPDWGGETPRTLVVRADGTRSAASGELTAGQLRRIDPR